MNSKKTLIGAGLALIALAFAAGYAFRSGPDDVDNSPSPSPTVSVTTAATAQPATPTPKPVLHTVLLTGAGPVPKMLTIRVGDSVTFTNNTGAPYWLASDPHPTHDNCPGFDARRDLQQGDTYATTFTERRTCGYHNHSDPYNTAIKGTIIVQ